MSRRNSLSNTEKAANRHFAYAGRDSLAKSGRDALASPYNPPRYGQKVNDSDYVELASRDPLAYALTFRVGEDCFRDWFQILDVKDAPVG